jgi:hypothetical protein
MNLHPQGPLAAPQLAVASNQNAQEFSAAQAPEARHMLHTYALVRGCNLARRISHMTAKYRDGMNQCC